MIPPDSPIEAKWLETGKDAGHRILLGGTQNPLCSLRAYLPNESRKALRPPCIKIAVKLEGKETQLLVDIKGLSLLLGVQQDAISDMTPKKLGHFITGEIQRLAALDEAANRLSEDIPIKQRSAALKRTAQAVSNVATKAFAKAMPLPIVENRVQFWQGKPARELGSGSFGAAHTVELLEGGESPHFVLKLAHSLTFFLKACGAMKRARSKAHAAAEDVKNEFSVLREVHQNENGEREIKPGIQLAPYALVALGKGAAQRVGYLGARYDSDLFESMEEFATPDSALQLLQGLNALRDKISLGDIKPENIFVRGGTSPRVDLADFGGARTKRQFKEIWDEGMQVIEGLKRKRAEVMMQAQQSLLKRLWEGPQEPPALVKILDEAISEAKEDLYFDLGQTYSEDYVPEEAEKKEYAAIEVGSFEAWFAFKQRCDLFALGVTLAKLFEDREDRLTPRQFEVIEKMRDSKGNPFYTSQEALQEWQQPVSSKTAASELAEPSNPSLIQRIMNLFYANNAENKPQDEGIRRQRED